MELIQEYSHTVSALGGMALLLLVQLLIADIIGIRRRHTPGSPVAADHSNLLFRASRAVANTNESIAVFILAVLFCILSQASPAYTAYAAWGFVLSRAIYAVLYYGNLQTPRSVLFGVSILFIVALLILGFSA